eukprot:TRINITY_DN254_c0_g1_i1.p1 TRINITY_DN254_c0_g1~~TRINITY_DN254_c0_g1_i1.p1  ORF type:complete len:774 (+),score=158.70 TRINITY_DN254_c0_g1_i1:51-2372(+)
MGNSVRRLVLLSSLLLALFSCSLGLTIENSVFSPTTARITIHADEGEWRVPDVVQESTEKGDAQFKISHDKQKVEVTRLSDGETVLHLTGVKWDTQYREVTLTVADNPNLYGLGERLQDLKLNTGNVKYPLFNHDNPNMPNLPMYGTHPYLYEVRNGKAHGYFFLNTNIQEFTLNNNEVTYRTSGGVIDLFVFVGPSVQDIVAQYQTVIGKPVLPPPWALGVHQSRWGYKDLDALKAVKKGFKDNELPLDVIWADIDYMDGFRVFSTDPIRFPMDQYNAFLDELHEEDMKHVVIMDPGIKTDNSYKSYTRLLQSEMYIKNNDGTPVVNSVWPGKVIFPDFSHPDIDDYWTTEIMNFPLKIDGIWIDMNEPATFEDSNCAHNNYNFPPWSPLPFEASEHSLCLDGITHQGSHLYNTHSMYGFWEMAATRRALITKHPNERPFILTRSSFSGSGHYGFHWGGDNWSRWDQLQASIPQAISMTTAGFSVFGPDTCGFLNNSTEELCTRWSQVATFYPFYRNHNFNQSSPQEPYVFSSQHMNIVRTYSGLRLMYFPEAWNLQANAHLYGHPVLRAMHYYYSDEYSLADQTQFFFGSNFLVAPILEEGAVQRQVYLPKEDVFYDLKGDRMKSGLITVDAPIDILPVYIRGGGAYLAHSISGLTVAETRKNDMNLHIALDADRKSAAEIFINADFEPFEPNVKVTALATDSQLRVTVDTNNVKDDNSYMALSVFGAPKYTKCLAGGHNTAVIYTTESSLLVVLPENTLKVSDSFVLVCK